MTHDTGGHHYIFIILLVIPISLSVIFVGIYLREANIHGMLAPRNYRVYNFSIPNATVIVTLPNMVIPVPNAFDSKKANITVDIYSKQNNIKIQGIKLSSNDSSLHFDSNLISKNYSNPTQVFSYTIPVEGWHRFEVTNHTETYNLHILMTNNSSAKNHEKSQTTVTTKDFKWPIQTQDLSNVMYFSIIFIGVLISRIFPLSSDSRSKPLGFKLEPVELAWVPFSAIITRY